MATSGDATAAGAGSASAARWKPRPCGSLPRGSDATYPGRGIARLTNDWRRPGRDGYSLRLNRVVRIIERLAATTEPFAAFVTLDLIETPQHVVVEVRAGYHRWDA